jgi:hypothetical protein
MEMRGEIKMAHFTPQARPLSTHARGCSVGPAMHVVAKNKIIVLARNHTPVIRLAARHFTVIAIPTNMCTIFYIFTH